MAMIESDFPNNGGGIFRKNAKNTVFDESGEKLDRFTSNTLNNRSAKSAAKRQVIEQQQKQSSASSAATSKQPNGSAFVRNIDRRSLGGLDSNISGAMFDWLESNFSSDAAAIPPTQISVGGASSRSVGQSNPPNKQVGGPTSTIMTLEPWQSTENRIQRTIGQNSTRLAAAKAAKSAPSSPRPFAHHHSQPIKCVRQSQNFDDEEYSDEEENPEKEEEKERLQNGEESANQSNAVHQQQEQDLNRANVRTVGRLHTIQLEKQPRPIGFGFTLVTRDFQSIADLKDDKTQAGEEEEQMGEPVLIRSVLPGGPAANQLQRHDRLMRIDGEAVVSMAGVLDRLRNAEQGTRVTLEVSRQEQQKEEEQYDQENSNQKESNEAANQVGEEFILDLEPITRRKSTSSRKNSKNSSSDGDGSGGIGLSIKSASVATTTSGDATDSTTHNSTGNATGGGALLIEAVESGSPAELSKLRAGDVVVAIEGVELRNLSFPEAVSLLQRRVESIVAQPGMAEETSSVGSGRAAMDRTIFPEIKMRIVRPRSISLDKQEKPKNCAKQEERDERDVSRENEEDATKFKGTSKAKPSTLNLLPSKFGSFKSAEQMTQSSSSSCNRQPDDATTLLSSGGISARRRQNPPAHSSISNSSRFFGPLHQSELTLHLNSNPNRYSVPNLDELLRAAASSSSSNNSPARPTNRNKRQDDVAQQEEEGEVGFDVALRDGSSSAAAAAHYFSRDAVGRRSVSEKRKSAFVDPTKFRIYQETRRGGAIGAGDNDATEAGKHNNIAAATQSLGNIPRAMRSHSNASSSSYSKKGGRGGEEEEEDDAMNTSVLLTSSFMSTSNKSLSAAISSSTGGGGVGGGGVPPVPPRRSSTQDDATTSNNNNNNNGYTTLPSAARMRRMHQQRRSQQQQQQQQRIQSARSGEFEERAAIEEAGETHEGGRIGAAPRRNCASDRHMKSPLALVLSEFPPPSSSAVNGDAIENGELQLPVVPRRTRRSHGDEEQQQEQQLSKKASNCKSSSSSVSQCKQNINRRRIATAEDTTLSGDAIEIVEERRNTTQHQHALHQSQQSGEDKLQRRRRDSFIQALDNMRGGATDGGVPGDTSEQAQSHSQSISSAAAANQRPRRKSVSREKRSAPQPRKEEDDWPAPPPPLMTANQGATPVTPGGGGAVMPVANEETTRRIIEWQMECTKAAQSGREMPAGNRGETIIGRSTSFQHKRANPPSANTSERSGIEKVAPGEEASTSFLSSFHPHTHTQSQSHSKSSSRTGSSKKHVSSSKSQKEQPLQQRPALLNVVPAGDPASNLEANATSSSRHHRNSNQQAAAATDPTRPSNSHMTGGGSGRSSGKDAPNVAPLVPAPPLQTSSSGGGGVMMGGMGGSRPHSSSARAAYSKPISLVNAGGMASLAGGTSRNPSSLPIHSPSRQHRQMALAALHPHQHTHTQMPGTPPTHHHQNHHQHHHAATHSHSSSSKSSTMTRRKSSISGVSGGGGGGIQQTSGAIYATVDKLVRPLPGAPGSSATLKYAQPPPPPPHLPAQLDTQQQSHSFRAHTSQHAINNNNTNSHHSNLNVYRFGPSAPSSTNHSGSHSQRH